MLLDECDEEASNNHIWNDMETIWKESADEIIGKLRPKRSNAWISNETIRLAATREKLEREEMSLNIRDCEMRYNDVYVETRTAGWRTNARHLISSIEQEKQDSCSRKSEK